MKIDFIVEDHKSVTEHKNKHNLKLMWKHFLCSCMVFFAGRCGDCKKDGITTSTFSGALDILNGSVLQASSLEPVPINISTHFKIVRQSGMASCRLRQNISRFRLVQTAWLRLNNGPRAFTFFLHSSNFGFLLSDYLASDLPGGKKFST